jgi:hypothetical protein
LRASRRLASHGDGLKIGAVHRARYLRHPSCQRSGSGPFVHAGKRDGRRDLSRDGQGVEPTISVCVESA